MTLANPGTNEPFSTATVNANFEAVDTDAGTTDASIVSNTNAITALGVRATALEAQHAIVGTVTQFTVASLAALDALATAVVGDEAVFSAAPSTGITFEGLKAQAVAGSGATIDWRFTSDIYAATKANLDTFIAAVVAITDLATGFVIGSQAFAVDTGIRYRFTSTAGAYAAMPGLILPSAATNGTVTDGVVTSTAQSLVRVRDAFPSGFSVHKVTFDITASAASGISLKFAVDATDAATAYDSQRTTSLNATVAASQTLNGTSGEVSAVGVATARHFGEILITDANVAGPTYWNARATVAPPGAMTTATGMSLSAGLHRTATAYNSLTIAPGSGNVTIHRLTVEGVS